MDWKYFWLCVCIYKCGEESLYWWAPGSNYLHKHRFLFACEAKDTLTPLSFSFSANRYTVLRNNHEIKTELILIFWATNLHVSHCLLKATFPSLMYLMSKKLHGWEITVFLGLCNTFKLQLVSNLYLTFKAFLWCSFGNRSFFEIQDYHLTAAIW